METPRSEMRENVANFEKLYRIGINLIFSKIMNSIDEIGSTIDQQAWIAKDRSKQLLSYQEL